MKWVLRKKMSLKSKTTENQSSMNDLSTQANHFFENHDYRDISGTSLTIVAWQLKTPENIGSIIRTAGNLVVKQLIIVYPDSIEYKSYKYERVAGGALDKVPIITTTASDAWQKIEQKSQYIALETSSNSTNIYLTKLPDNMTLFVGNEQRGLPEEVINRCTQTVHIPLPGTIKSMNVSHATAVAAFEWYRQKAFF
jgi:tRNA G18 (ribose-2'-O)-methylase SpoU